MLTGGCSCGAVRYEAGGEPMGELICYCHSCQRASGSGHLPVMLMPKALFSVEGDCRSYARPAEAGKQAFRNFCPQCGSLLFGTPEAAPDAVALYVGTLDNSSVFRPTRAIHIAERGAWEGDALEEYQGPPDTRG